MTAREAHPRHVPLDWVLVADATWARCYVRETDDPALRELAAFEPAAPCRRAGSRADDRGDPACQPGADEPSQPDGRLFATDCAVFARELARFLENAALAQRFHQLALIGSPPFLGELRKRLGKATETRLLASLALDLPHSCTSELEHRVAQALRELG